MNENQGNAPRPIDDQALGSALGRAIGTRRESLNRVPPVADALKRSAAAARARRVRRTVAGVAAAVVLLVGGLIAGNTLGGDDGDGTVRVATELTGDATTAAPAPSARPPTTLDKADSTDGGAAGVSPSAAAEFSAVEDPESSAAVDGSPTDGSGGTGIVVSVSTSPSPAEPDSDSPSLEDSANEIAARYTAVSVSESHSCARRTNGTITCWGNNADGQSDAPAGQFNAVVAGGNSNAGYSCGERPDETITCWGNNADGQTDPPAGQFTAVAAGNSHACGLRTPSTIMCWGSLLRKIRVAAF